MPARRHNVPNKRVNDTSHQRHTTVADGPFHALALPTTWSEGIAVQSIPDAGRGVIACQALAPGKTVLISEPWATGDSYADLIVATVRQINPQSSETSGYFMDHILTLAGADEEWDGAESALSEAAVINPTVTRSQVLRIGSAIKHNAFQEGGRSYFFTDACLFNHSCFPNSSWTINAETRKIEVWTVLPVKAGAELTISYLGDDIQKPRDERMKALKASWGFECKCRKCQESA